MTDQDVYVALMAYLTAIDNERGARTPEDAARLHVQAILARLAYENVLQACALRLPGATGARACR